MATSGNFPSSHTTTTTTTTTRVSPALRFDPYYCRTIPGILKIVQMVLDLLGFICIMVSHYSWMSRASWFSFVAMTGFWVTGILLAFYLCHLVEKLYMLPWLLLEFIYCAVWTLFYFIAACVAAAWASHDEAFGAASFFGFAAIAAYGYDAFLKFRGWRSGELAQGERQVTTSSSTSPTAY